MSKPLKSFINRRSDLECEFQICYLLGTNAKHFAMLIKYKVY